MKKVNEFKLKQCNKELSTMKKNRLRVMFILEHGMCEETLEEIISLSEDGNKISDTIATSLVEKYLYEPPMLNNGMAELIKIELIELTNKFGTKLVNNMVADMLYDDIGGLQYAKGVGRIIESLRKLNNM